MHNICVLDDDIYWINLLSKWIKKVNYDVNIIPYIDHNLFIKNLETIVKLDCIIIDFYLLGTTALEIIPKIRNINKDILIVCVSSKFNNGHDFELMKKVLNSGATRVCPKNLDIFEMILDTHYKIGNK